MTSEKPHFLIIMTDEHNPFVSEPFGHPFIQTPNVQRLADRDVLFEYGLVTFADERIGQVVDALWWTIRASFRIWRTIRLTPPSATSCWRWCWRTGTLSASTRRPARASGYGGSSSRAVRT